MTENDIDKYERNPFDDDTNFPGIDPTDEALPQTSKPLIAGILLIIAGLLAIITWVSALTIDLTMLDPSLFQTNNMTITPAQLESFVQICATIGIILSIFPLLGGILSIQRKLWGGAVACSIIAIFTVGPVFLSSIMGIIAVILVFLSKDEFKK